MKEYSSGYYKVPSVGAGTANTEFESITGMSMHYFGPGEYPYKSILRETTCESAPYVLKNLAIPPMRFIIMRQTSMEEDLFSRISDLILLLPKSTWQERMRRIQMAG